MQCLYVPINFIHIIKKFHLIFFYRRNIEVYVKSFTKLFNALHDNLLAKDTHKEALCLFCLVYLTFCIENNCDIANCRTDLCHILDKWLKKADVIGSAQFGGLYSWFNHLSPELQV